MTRWRYCLVLATLLLLPPRICSEPEDEEEEEQNEEGNGEDDNDDGDEEEAMTEKASHVAGRRAPAIPPSTLQMMVTRTTKKRHLECYMCAFKAETPPRACLDPTKFRVHTATCPSPDDKCYTSAIPKGSSFEAVVRGCRSGCVGSSETVCCDENRCNDQAFALPPVAQPKMLTNKSSKSLHPTVLFFVTILLLLQTVVKVAFV